MKYNLRQSCNRVDGDLYQECQKVGGVLCQNDQKVYGDLSQYGQLVNGDLYQTHQKVKGNLIQERKEKTKMNNKQVNAIIDLIFDKYCQEKASYSNFESVCKNLKEMKVELKKKLEEELDSLYKKIKYLESLTKEEKVIWYEDECSCPNCATQLEDDNGVACPICNQKLNWSE